MSWVKEIKLLVQDKDIFSKMVFLPQTGRMFPVELNGEGKQCINNYNHRWTKIITHQITRQHEEGTKEIKSDIVNELQCQLLESGIYSVLSVNYQKIVTRC